MKACPYCKEKDANFIVFSLKTSSWYQCPTCDLFVLLHSDPIKMKTVEYNIENSDFCREFGLSLGHGVTFLGDREESK